MKNLLVTGNQSEGHGDGGGGDDDAQCDRDGQVRDPRVGRLRLPQSLQYQDHTLLLVCRSQSYQYVQCLRSDTDHVKTS